MTATLRLWPDPILVQRCDLVPPAAFEAAPNPAQAALRLAVEDLLTVWALVVQDAKAGKGAYPAGLAGPQAGHALAVALVSGGGRGAPPRVVVNPECVAIGPRYGMAEGCLSSPGLTRTVPRGRWVLARWQDVSGAWHERKLTGLEAHVFQHEADHLRGQCLAMGTP